MAYEFISISTSVLVVIGYIPEIYIIIVNRRSDLSNTPIWIIWLIASALGVIYCGLNQYYVIMINYLLNFFLCSVSCLCIVYFRFNNPNKTNIGDEENNTESLETIDDYV